MKTCPICNTDNDPAVAVCRACGASLAGDPVGGFTSALRPGTQLNGGQYAVGKVLGQGGFGITYLGSDARMRRPVAVKEFFPHGSTRQGQAVQGATIMSAADYTSTRTKFLDEARILARFHHPGIVKVYDVFEENNTAYMVMEYLRGRSLEGLLEDRGLLPEDEAVDYITRAGEALEVVHAASLLHRDLKPGNIMLTDDDRVVLIDFGTARTYVAGKTGRMTTMVTPGYAPLEQYGQHVRFGPFTDVYALGATLYHLLTGQMPTDATDRVSGVVLKSPREVNPAVSTPVSDAVMWAMAIKVAERPQTVRAFLDALAAADEAPTPAPAPAAPEPAPLPSWLQPTPARAPAPPAAPAISLPDQGPYDIVMQGDRLAWPDRCACCFEAADASYTAEHTGGDGAFFVFEETRSWNVPYCSQCLQHVDKTLQASGPDFGKVAAGTLAGSLLGPAVGLLVGLGVAAHSIGTAARQSAELQALLRPTCTAAGPAVAYLGWDGDHHAFSFASRPFVEAFIRENPGHLVS